MVLMKQVYIFHEDGYNKKGDRTKKAKHNLIDVAVAFFVESSSIFFV